MILDALQGAFYGSALATWIGIWFKFDWPMPWKWFYLGCFIITGATWNVVNKRRRK